MIDFMEESSPDVPDPERAADQLLNEPEESETPRRRGRPKGSKTKRRSVSRPSPVSEEPIEELPPSPAEITAMATLGGVIWALVGERVANLTPLTQAETLQLGTAMVPVFRKYAKALGGWEAEITLLIVAGGLIISHMPQRRSEDATSDGFQN